MSTPLIGDAASPGRPESDGAALHEQREWLRVTLASIGDAVVTTDAQGRVTFLNPVAQALTGWSAEDAVGLPLERVFRIVNETTHLEVESPTVRALRDGVIVGLANHTLLIARDGSERPIDDNAAPIRDERGEVAGVVLVFRDVSGRRRQEREAQSALAYVEDVIATLREPFVVLDGQMNVRTANRAFYDAFETTRSETEGRAMGGLGQGQWDVPRLGALCREELDGRGSVEDFEVEQASPGFGSRTLLLNARRFGSDDHQPGLILLGIEDVTERRRSDAALRESELRYRRLFQTAKDGILILDVDTGTILDANPFMCGLLGYEIGEFIGKELWQIGLFEDVGANRAAYALLKERGYIRYEHLPLKTKAGREVDVEFVSNLYQAGERPVAQCNIRDITERRRLEREAKAQVEALADLHRRKDEFLAMLAHELRNPLAPILNGLHILGLQGGENLVQEKARASIARQVGQLTRLIDDLMEVSRITSGRIRLKCEELDLRWIVERAVESARPAIERRRHRLRVQLPEAHVWLNADPARLEQVVLNLLNNAAKYTDEGGSIVVDLREDGPDAVLSVKDDGIGIAADLLPRIFDLFTQADRSLDRSQGGLGIGLTLVKRLVEIHRGTVEARSEGISRGTEFVVRLPLSTEAVHPTAAPELGLDEPPRVDHPRVLVVDDNVDYVEGLAVLLEMEGYEVRVAHTGPGALEVAPGFAPQVVLMDIGLPGLNGYEVARRLRQDPGLAAVHLVAMSGYGRESDLELSLDSGFNAHLVKPTAFPAIRALLAEYFATKASGGG